MREPCRIRINYEDKEHPVEMDSGDISFFEIADALQVILHHCALEISKVAEKKCGPNMFAQEKWIDEMISQYVKRPLLDEDDEQTDNLPT